MKPGKVRPAAAAAAVAVAAAAAVAVAAVEDTRKPTSRVTDMNVVTDRKSAVVLATYSAERCPT